MSSIVLELRCAAADAEELVDLLWRSGTTGIAIEEATDGSARLLAGFEGDPAQVPQRVASLQMLAPSASIRLATAVEETWRAFATAHRVGPFGLRLPEHPADTDAVDLCIEPGHAFGSGTHESTRLALAAMAAAEPSGRTVADVGTGTGVLAIGAALLGAASIDAVDIDPAAVATARANASRNRVTVEVRLGSVTALPRAHYDLVTSNLTAGVQRSVAPDVIGRLAPAGRLVLAGVLRDQLDQVQHWYPGFDTSASTADGQWACVVLVAPDR